MVLESMYNDGMSISMIADKTDYSIKDITSILQNLHIIN